ncbi:MAG: hypothetical protein UV80_C0008G0028 [Candidatus Peregrinibacteria bacterium GW2011_GWF2_43_17]|nr:MAG: hypothetical protein UV80_C0008G0028 [Candidatus Peregrinibacteria bacterium GW2011_GWF2_43_17]HAU39495.1 hypothetical protein [Candidatus Peregrinibacteria bacterium]
MNKYAEHPEHGPSMHCVDFERSRFGDQQIDTRRYYHWIPGAVNTWWSQICLENGFDPQKKRLQLMAYYLIEIAKNTFENVGSGEIKVTFEPAKITIVVTDQGTGFENPNEDMIPNHGLDQVKRYADTFTIETNGRKFTKVKGRRELVETTDTNIRQGSKITFSKTRPQTVRDLKRQFKEKFGQDPTEWTDQQRDLWRELNLLGTRNMDRIPPTTTPDIDTTVKLSRTEIKRLLRNL